MKNKHLPKLRQYENRFYLLGIVTGFFISIVLHFGIYLYDISAFSVDKITNHQQSISFQLDTNNRLLKYVEGKWVSSIEDMYVRINISKTKDINILEFVNNKTEKLFKIVNVVNVDGMLGYINLEICELKSSCATNELIPIQINKIFGLQDTISMSYDSRIAVCLENENLCIRAFKREN